MNTYTFGFEKLSVWQKSRIYAAGIYKVTQDFPKSEMYGLTSQLRRSAISVSSNLAEGTARKTSKDQAHFTTVAYSSLMESVNQLILSFDLEYLDNATYQNLRAQAVEISRMLTALKKAQIRS
ncbi:MAG: four helix bundle protein [Phaeodactylibacter sp.]|uniref:four helix bundle protein n=1 Tax=Phaeodactylibacter sp. TaxID=1940289 RepID=UPI0032ECB198